MAKPNGCVLESGLMSQLYDDAYFTRLHGASYDSAREVVPVLLSIYHPRSIVDIGCGTGAWLSVFREHGISDVFGVDGEYVSHHLQSIESERFIRCDLSKPFDIGRVAELAVSLEVAEHLPPESAEPFIYSLTRIAPVVMFSAAIPRQGGTGHINEQWPDYWAAIFRSHDYSPIDCIRPRIWNNPRVSVWFRQNIIMYVREDHLRTSPVLSREHETSSRLPLSIVHPDLFLLKCQQG